MCGIAGFSGNFDPVFLEKANAVQAHRGPDDAGTWHDPAFGIGLAHRRLSIIDLSDAASQPMFTRDKRMVVVYNGEIYNFRELRKELEREGAAFRTHSDTEVLLRLYQRLGHAMLEKLNGIFAFALWDGDKRELFLARDGMGVKPLYIVQNERGFAFASEIKALLKLPGIDRSIDPDAVHQTLAYLWCPAPRTILKSVRKLEPGNALVVQDGRVRKRWRHYDLSCGETKGHPSRREMIETVPELLRRAVHRQMVSDVPVGAFLSGGLDSSAVVRFAREQVSNNELDCFTIAFDSSGGEFDGFAEDLPYAKRVARELDVPLHVVTVGPDMATRFGEMIYHLDEPQADPAPLNALFICELARDHGIKVLLSGAGGDDLFTGYRRHAALRAERLWAWLPLSSRRALRNLGALFPQDRPFGRRVERAFRHADSDPVERLVGYFLWIDEHVQRTLYTPDFEKALGGRSAMAPLRKSLEEVSGASDPLDRMLYLELRHFLADHNLNYTDKTGMAAGVEVRVPFLDPELVEYASKIPASEKFRGRTSKYLLKKAMEPYLPRSVIYRPKSGFGVPLRKWLHGRMRGVMLDLLSEKSLKKRGLFDANRVKQLIDKDFRGETDAAYPLFSLMCIEWWQRIFLDETG